jgi:tetratricopeptide (TPR) repeat protein
MRINIKLLAGTVVALVVLVVGAYVLHAMQYRRIAAGLKERADRERELNHPQEEARCLAEYIGIVGNRADVKDVDTFVRYSELLDESGKNNPLTQSRIVDLLERAVSLDRERYDIRRKVAEKAIAIGRWGDAQIHTEILITQFPEDWQLLDWRGQIYEGVGDHDKSSDCWTKALEKDPGLIDTSLRLAVVQKLYLHEDVKSTTTLEDMVKANSANFGAYLNRVRFNLRFPPSKDNDKAWVSSLWDDTAEARKLLSDDPDAQPKYCKDPDRLRADVLFYSALAAQYAAQLPGASEDKIQFPVQNQITFLVQGVAAYREDYRFYESLANAYVQASRFDNAARVLRQLLKILETKPGSQNLAQTQLHLGEILIADGKLEEAKELDSADNPSVLARILHARILIAEKNWRGAADALEATRAQFAALAANQICQAELLLASCYEQLGEPDRRLDACRRAIAADPDRTDAHLALTTALSANARSWDALIEYRRLLNDKVHPLPKETQGKVAQNAAQLLILQELQLAKSKPNKQSVEIDRYLGLAKDSLPDSPRNDVLRAQFEVIQDKPTEGRKRLVDAITKNAANLNPEALRTNSAQLELWLGLIALDEQMGNAEAVLKDVDAARREIGEHVELQLARVRHWARQQPAASAKPLADLELEAKKLDNKNDKARLFAALADAHRAAARTDKAQQLWTEVSTLRKEDLQSRFALLDLILARPTPAAEGAKETATRLVEEIKSIEGAEGAAWRCYNAALLIFFGNAEQSQQVNELLIQAAQRRPNWPRVPRLQGDFADRHGESVHAIDFYQRAFDLGERDPRVMLRLLKLLTENNRIQETNALRKAADADLLNVTKNALLDALKRNDRQSAISLAHLQVPEGSENLGDQLSLALLLAKLEDGPGAEIALKQARKIDDRASADKKSRELWITQVAVFHDLQDKERLDAALKEAEQRLARLDAPLSLAQCYEIVARFDDAEAQYKKALSAKPEDAPTLRSVATFYMLRGQLPKAEPLLRQLATLKAADADKAWAKRTLAIGIANRGDPRQLPVALELIEENLRARPDSIEDVRAKAVVLATQPDRIAEAIAVLEKLDESSHLASEDQFLLAKLYNAEENWAKARERMHALIAEASGSPNYLAAYIGSLMQHKEFDEAKSLLQRLENLEPKAFSTLELRVRLSHTTGEKDKAIELLKTGAQEKDAPLQKLAALAESLGETATADAIFQQLTENSRKPEDLLQYALFLGRANQPTKGLAICESLRKLNPVDPVALVTVTVVRAKATTDVQRNEVEAWLKSVIDKTPSTKLSPNLLAYWAELRDLRGLYELAEQDWQAVLKRDPNHTVALNNLACLLAFRAAPGDEALVLINRALDSAGHIPELLDSRALVYMSRNDAKSAIADLEAATKRGPSASKYYHLARAYLMDGRTRAAQDAWNKALDANISADNLHALEAKDLEAFRVKMSSK